MTNETISEKCETLYNKLNAFVTSVISRDVTPKISNLNTEVWGSDTQTGNSRINTIESDVSNLQTSVNSLSDSITNLNTRVKGLEVGGNFGDNILYAPLLNGTETVYTIPYDANGTSINFQPIISDNQLKDGAGYLSDGWDNTVNWELTFEYYTTGDNNGYTVIPLGTDKRDYNGIQQWYNKQLKFYVNGDKPTGYLYNASLKLNTWVSVKITKEDYIWKVYYDNILKTTFDLSSYSSIVDTWTTICIGVDRNISRNSAVIRNIIVKKI